MACFHSLAGVACCLQRPRSWACVVDVIVPPFFIPQGQDVHVGPGRRCGKACMALPSGKAPAPVQRGAWPPHMLCRETGAFQPPSTAAAKPPHALVSLMLSTLQSSSVCAPDLCNDGVPKTGCYAAGAFLPPSSASSEVPRGQGTLGHLPLRPSRASQPSTHGGCGSASEVAHGGTLRIPLLRPNGASAPVLPGGWRSILLNREAITPPSSATHGSPELPPLRPRRASAPDLLGGWGRAEPICPQCPALPPAHAAWQPPAAAPTLSPDELLAVYSNQACELQLGSEAVVKLAAAAAKAAAIAVFSGRHGLCAADAVRHFLPSYLHPWDSRQFRLPQGYMLGVLLFAFCGTGQ